MLLNDWLELGKDVDEKAKQEWRNAGQVKRRWFAFIGGAIFGVGVSLICLSLFGCSGQQPQAHQTGPNSACFDGPKVVE